jgi:hypothetical protein
VIRVYDEAGNVIEMHEHADEIAKNFILIIRARVASLAEKLDAPVNRNICQMCGSLGKNSPRKDNGAAATAD